MMRTCIVADDEPLARSRMQRLLARIDGLQLLGTAENGEEALQLAKEVAPDIVFLDIQMPIMDGLQAARCMIEQLDTAPAVVFCTAYNDFAVQAFDVSAVAYLVKPVAEDDLQRALDRATRLSQLQLSAVLEEQNKPSCVTVFRDGGLEKLEINRVVYFRSEDKCIWAGIDSGDEILVDEVLKQLEAKYAENFVRAHRNSLINKTFLKRLSKDSEGKPQVELRNHTRCFAVSRRHLNDVKRSFG